MRPFLCTISRIFCAVVLRKKKKKKNNDESDSECVPPFFQRGYDIKGFRWPEARAECDST